MQRHHAMDQPETTLTHISIIDADKLTSKLQGYSNSDLSSFYIDSDDADVSGIDFEDYTDAVALFNK